MRTLKEDVPEGFSKPADLPRSADQQEQWQESNRSWWESHPMRYDFTDQLGLDEFSPEYYREIDRRFFASVRRFMPWSKIPFDPVIDFEGLRDKNVLEIGVGCGSHAQLLATHAKSFTGIDLTEYAIESTSKRLQGLNIDASIRREDAEKLPFEDGSFDFIWSWGVIHHSSDTRTILREMARVLRPGGRASVMVYHRSFWIYYFAAGFIRGILMGELFRTGSLNKTLQRWSDGAIARYYTTGEWQAEVAEFFDASSVRIFGEKVELFPLPAGRVKNFAMRLVPDAVSRFVTNNCKQGRFLFCTMEKR